MLCDPTYRRYPVVGHSLTETESRMVSRGWKEGARELVMNGDSFSLGKREFWR